MSPYGTMHEVAPTNSTCIQGQYSKCIVQFNFEGESVSAMIIEIGVVCIGRIGRGSKGGWKIHTV